MIQQILKRIKLESPNPAKTGFGVDEAIDTVYQRLYYENYIKKLFFGGK